MYIYRFRGSHIRKTIYFSYIAIIAIVVMFSSLSYAQDTNKTRLLLKKAKDSDVENAIKIYEEIVNDDPSNLDAISNLIFIYEYQEPNVAKEIFYLELVCGEIISFQNIEKNIRL